MLSLVRIALVALAICFASDRQASAGCVRFDKTSEGYAFLVNTCDGPVNAAYVVVASGTAVDFDANVTRTSMPANSRTQLWSAGDPPVRGHYEIKVLSCRSPLTLIFRTGGSPICQLSTADAG